MSMKIRLASLAIATVASGLAHAQNSERIRLNQIGYAYGSPKIAISLDTTSDAALVDSATGADILPLVPGTATRYMVAGKIIDTTCRTLDFSGFNIPGAYRLRVGTQLSHAFRIGPNPYERLTKASIKALWHNRSSYETLEPFAGLWARPAGHPDTAVIIHPSAASAKRPAGSTIRSPGGWYDAGDYGKYIVNSGISTWTLLHLYESAPAYFDSLSLDVPSHGAVKSDLVDEILWNLRWMLTMQDPEDGGVYHKLTTLGFNGFEMPDSDLEPRYAVQKTTTAALDLAAVAAYAARLFRGRSDLPGFADSCQSVALAAWNWARRNPTAYFDEAALKNHETLPVTTGAYGDGNATDEFQWAASELFLTTQADSFAVAGELATKPFAGKWNTPNWGSVATLGWLSLQSSPSLLTGSLAGIKPRLDSALYATVLPWSSSTAASGYRLPNTISFNWGSNSGVANMGMLLWKAWQTSKDSSYRRTSLDLLDYLSGRNATGYCFVTGFGGKTPKKPHHRPSGADGVPAPVPGFLVGGPNANFMRDGDAGIARYFPNGENTLSAKAYADHVNSYSTNEVAINWNAPLAFLAGSWSAELTRAPGTGIHGLRNRSDRNLRTSLQGGTVHASIPGQELSKLELLGTDGRVLASTQGKAASLALSSRAKGFFLLRAVTIDGHSAIGSVLIP